LVPSARQFVQPAQEAPRLRPAFAVLMSAALNASMEQIARVLRAGRAAISRLRSWISWRTDAVLFRPGWGERRRTLVSEDEVWEFLPALDSQSQLEN